MAQNQQHGALFEVNYTLLDTLYEQDVHAQRLAALKDGLLGVAESSSLNIHAISRGLAAVHNLCDKHAVKQIDRLIGNDRLDVDALSATWARWFLGSRTDVYVNLDCTDFDSSGRGDSSAGRLLSRGI